MFDAVGPTPSVSSECECLAGCESQESVVNTPLPLYFEASEEVALSKVTLRYKPFGEKVYKS